MTERLSWVIACGMVAVVASCVQPPEDEAPVFKADAGTEEIAQTDDATTNEDAADCAGECPYSKECVMGSCMPKKCTTDPVCNPPGGGSPGSEPWYCFRGLCATYQCADTSDCGDGQDCNDQTNLCYDVAKGCTIASQCADANPCTADSCNKVTGKCKHVAVADCCNTAADCKVRAKCTKASCLAGKCVYTTRSKCCTEDAECYDSKVCTEDRCKSNACVYTPIANCCTGSGSCDDDDATSEDICHAGKCLHQWPGVAKTCKTTKDCGGSLCLKGSCHQGACGYEHTGASGCCDGDAACVTKKVCHIGKCLARVCQLQAETPMGVYSTSTFDKGSLNGWKVFKGNKLAYFHFNTVDKYAGTGCVRYGVPGKTDIGPGNNNSGTLTSGKFKAPATNPGLRFQVYFEGNPISSVQVFGLRVIAGGKVTEVWNKTKDLGGSTQQQWKTQQVSLAPWAGQAISLQLYFDVKFATNKEKKKGLMVDEMSLLGGCPQGP